MINVTEKTEAEEIYPEDRPSSADNLKRKKARLPKIKAAPSVVLAVLLVFAAAELINMFDKNLVPTGNEVLTFDGGSVREIKIYDRNSSVKIFSSGSGDISFGYRTYRNKKYTGEISDGVLTLKSGIIPVNTTAELYRKRH